MYQALPFPIRESLAHTRYTVKQLRIETNGAEVIRHATQVEVQRRDVKLELVLMGIKMGLGKAGCIAELRYPVSSPPILVQTSVSFFLT